MPPLTYANYAMGPLQVRLSFRIELLTNLLIYVGVCSGVCSQLSGAMLDAIFTNGGYTAGVCTTAALEAYPWQSYIHLGDDY